MTRTAARARMAPDVLRILLVDDHLLVADTVAAALQETGEFDAVTVPSIEACLACIEEHGPFDVVLLDYDLPDSQGLSGLRRVIEANGGCVALFSGVAGRLVAAEAVSLGALGFVPKTLPLKVLKHAIRFISAGEVYLPSSLIQAGQSGGENAPNLRPREEKVLTLLAEGLQNKEISRLTGLAETTVKNDVKSLCRKLDARNRTEVVLSARRLGLV